MLKKTPFFVFVVFFVFAACENSTHSFEADIPGSDDSDSAEIDDSGSDFDSDSAETDDRDVQEEPLFNLKVEENKQNSLSCRLTFSTADEVQTFVKYYSATHAGYIIRQDSAKKEHYFFLWGMRENLDYTIEIYTDEEKPELLATTEFHSGFVPESVVKPHLVTNDREFVQPGFVLFSQLADPDTVEMPSVIFMVDTDGFVVWYFEHSLAGYAILSDAEYHKKTQTIFAGMQKGMNMADIPSEEGVEINLEGNILWKSPDIASYNYSATGWHHDYKLLDDGTILFLQAVYDGDLVTDRIVNVDRDYNELWDWGYLDSPDYFNEITCVDPEAKWCDWTHTNTAFTDEGKHFVYFNSRRLGFFKMDTATKEIVWKFGKGGDFTMLSYHIYPWPDYPHDPKISSDGKRMLFYDNGWEERNYSRVIEYIFDEDEMTAEISFEFDGFQQGRIWFAPAFGDADYLENGNIFVTKGMMGRPENSSLFEITRDGRVVWELYTEQNDNFMIEVFNSDKFVPPLEFNR